MNKPHFPLDYTGYLTVITLWLSLLCAVLIADFNLFGMKPLSSLGVTPGAKLFFSGGLLIAAMTFIVFAQRLVETYRLSRKFFIAVLIGQLGQILTAIIPYGGEQSDRALHTLAAFVLAISIPTMLFIFSRSQADNQFTRVTTVFFWIVLVAFVIGISLFVFSIGAAYAQALPAAVFHMWILYVNTKYLQTKTE